MACCKVCCGCKECDEGEEGKCCCGSGTEAACCQPGEYCCSGVCQQGPCEEPCDEQNPCPDGYVCCETAPNGDLGCVDQNWCGGDGPYCTACTPGTENGTLIGPYATEAAADAAGAAIADACSGGLLAGAIECGDGWYTEVCCEAAP